MLLHAQFVKLLGVEIFKPAVKLCYEFCLAVGLFIKLLIQNGVVKARTLCSFLDGVDYLGTERLVGGAFRAAYRDQNTVAAFCEVAVAAKLFRKRVNCVGNTLALE